MPCAIRVTYKMEVFCDIIRDVARKIKHIGGLRFDVARKIKHIGGPLVRLLDVT